MKRRKKPEDLHVVTSFRLPPDVKEFLWNKAQAAERPMAYVLIEYIRRWQAFEKLEAEQPGRQK